MLSVDRRRRQQWNAALLPGDRLRAHRPCPLGRINLLGLSAESLYLRDTLDKLKIEPQFVKIGPFKSAPEMFTENHPTPEAALELNAVLDRFYALIVDAVAKARNLRPEHVRDLVDNAPYTARDALALHLVDAIEYPDEFRAQLTRRASVSVRSTTILASFSNGPADGGRRGGERRPDRGRIGSPRQRGNQRAEGLVTLLGRTADDSDVSAVVLRVDSPGGSVLASDFMLHSVERVHRRKPVFVSMSDAAASGGYYIAALADRIVAEPATLTGSIGVFTGKSSCQLAAWKRTSWGCAGKPIAAALKRVSIPRWHRSPRPNRPRSLRPSKASTAPSSATLLRAAT